MLFKQEIPIKYDVDVFVAGGGPAGVAAAVSCARLGRAVYLAEATGTFGGMATNGYVPILMPVADGTHFLAGNVGREVRDGLSGRRDNADQSYPINPERLKQIFDDMVVSSGAGFSFFTSLIGVEAEEGEVKYAILSAKSGLFAVKANIFIDCTGDGDLAAMAGAAYEMGDEAGRTMPPTLCNLWANVDFERIKPKSENPLEKAIANGVFTYADRHLCGMFPIDHDNGIAIGNLGHCFGVDGTDETSLTKGMLLGRKQAREYGRYFTEYHEGYERIFLSATAPLLGVRETRRIIGDYTLTLEDFERRASFPDEIGRHSYPVDIHIMAPDQDAYDQYRDLFHNLRYQTGETYGIPYRTMTPAGLKNVLTAGRCISADRYMQSSLRVIPCCLITGQAAGAAAALTADSKDTRSVCVEKLRETLREAGVYLPEKGSGICDGR